PENAYDRYDVTQQVGYLLRTASQRHTAIFSNYMPYSVTRPQFAALVKLGESGSLSQNELGRSIEMDRVTIKGVVDRLQNRGYVNRDNDINDRRRRVVSLTETGSRIAKEGVKV